MDLFLIKYFDKGGSAVLYLVYDITVDTIRIFKLYTQTDKQIREKYLKYDRTPVQDIIGMLSCLSFSKTKLL